MRENPDRGPIFDTCDNLADSCPPHHPSLIFAARDVIEYRTAPCLVYCALMFAALITLPHFSVSSAMSLPKSADDGASAVAPRSVRRALMLGCARPALISLFSLSRISVDVSLRPAAPSRVLAY